MTPDVSQKDRCDNIVRMKACTLPPVSGVFAIVLLCLTCLVDNIHAQNSEPVFNSSEEFVLSDVAEAAGIDGSLTAILKVDKLGGVKDVKILAGPAYPCGTDPGKEIEAVRKAVIENLKTAKFTPRLKNGKATDGEAILEFAIGHAYRQTEAVRLAAEAQRSGTAPLVEKGVLTGKALRIPVPQYPSGARASRAGGAVPVAVLIDEQGTVISAGATGGHPALQFAARDAACGAKFAPTIFKGSPVKVSGVITFGFRP